MVDRGFLLKRSSNQRGNSTLVTSDRGRNLSYLCVLDTSRCSSSLIWSQTGCEPGHGRRAKPFAASKQVIHRTSTEEGPAETRARGSRMMGSCDECVCTQELPRDIETIHSTYKHEEKNQ